MADGMLSAAVSVAASGTLIAAITNAKLRIHSIVLAGASDVTAILLDGTTALTGAMTLAKTAGPLVLGQPRADCVLWELSDETAFKITAGGQVQISGVVWYTICPKSAYVAPSNEQIP